MILTAALLFSSGVLAAAAMFTQAAGDGPPDRAAAEKLFRDGNYDEALAVYRDLLAEPNDEAAVGADLLAAIQCLQQLGRVAEADELTEKAIGRHAENWRLLAAAAEVYGGRIAHYGALIEAEFVRGARRGRIVNATRRDRTRALQLLQQALPLAETASAGERAEFYLQLGRILRSQGDWRLQLLTDLETLPDYDEGWGYGGGGTGAPVDAEGSPVFHVEPKSWEAAADDGQRWRWALARAAEQGKGYRLRALHERAEFLHSQFGVQTLASFGFWRRSGGDELERKEGIFAVHTLGDEETIARLATGVKRFKLPDEQNFISLWREIADAEEGRPSESALASLASVFENRRQYEKAAEQLRRSIAEFGDQEHKRLRLDQIVENWGRFEPVATQEAGQARFGFRFRNATSVRFTARPIDVPQLVSDVQQYLRSRPNQYDWNQLNLEDLAQRILHSDGEKYVRDVAAEWTVDLDPRPDHWDRLISVQAPTPAPGAYWVTAEVAEGRTCHAVLWVADLAIVHKPLDQQALYFVADAATGEPIPGATLELFGYKNEHRRNNRVEFEFKNFAVKADASGLARIDAERTGEGFQFLVQARGEGDRYGMLGFSGLWRMEYRDQPTIQSKAFVLTDRPVYRPGHAVKLKAWVAVSGYGDEAGPIAGKDFEVVIRDPRGNEFFKQTYRTDDFGGIADEITLAEDATLGAYYIQVNGPGGRGGSFRVEEYKKPEFEVTIEAPDEPVALGDVIAAEVRAEYYFGGPVAEGTVKYKVLRTQQDDRRYPPRPWDWLYGDGYAWLAYDAAWHPSWSKWGCFGPSPWWLPRPQAPPEVVAEQEVPIGPDGVVRIEIDTAAAAELFSDSSHRYEITAEVTDASRRTITATGAVLAAKSPFAVTAWADRGHYAAGDDVTVEFHAHTLSGAGVPGTGEAKLYRLSVTAAGETEESLVETWPLQTDDDGDAQLRFRIPQAGQYRVALELTDGDQRTESGGVLLLVRGPGLDDANLQFGGLELVPDREQYAPGESVELSINAARIDSTVLLFVRPVNGVYQPPQVVKIDGKTTLAEIEVAAADQPNFFVEAISVSGATVHSEVRRIIVPPEKRVLEVVANPAREETAPGEEVEIEVTVTDSAGEPFVGQTVLTVYDKAVEYISGGSNVGDVRKFFWDWLRQHYPHTQHNLGRVGYSATNPDEPAMGDVGVFGGSTADDAAAGAFGGGGAAPEMQFRRGARSRLFMSTAEPAAMPQMARAETLSDELSLDQGVDAKAAAGEQLVEPTLRSQFADTAYWNAALATDEQGRATIRFVTPDDLTTWKIRAWGMGAGTRVGEGTAEFISTKNLLVRPQAPRFLVQSDEVVLSAVVHNRLPEAKDVVVRIDLGDHVFAGVDSPEKRVRIDAGGETRVDWRVKAIDEGRAVIRMAALTDEESDAAEVVLPSYIHGMLKTESYSGALRPEEQSAVLVLTVPEARRVAQSRLEIRYSPTLAGAMVDALPYLVEYPHGCTEQTLNRFLPTVIVQRILTEMGVDLAAVAEHRTNLNAQEIGDVAERAERWQAFDRNPVFDEAEVDRMVAAGLQRLAEMQLSDGGWGWFSGRGERSSAHTTGTVVHGLLIAQDAGEPVVQDVLTRGVAWLRRHQAEQVELLRGADLPEEQRKEVRWKSSASDLDAFVYYVLSKADERDSAMRDFLYRDRTKLSAYSNAMLGVALHAQGETEMVAMLLRNLRQFRRIDEENQTAYLDLPGDAWWRWYNSEYEANAMYLKLLAAVEPQGEDAARLAKHLLNSRAGGTYWNSTRDTALCIEALADFLRASGEAAPELTVDVLLDGRVLKTVEIDQDNLFTFDNVALLAGEEVPAGEHRIEVRKRGRGPLYFNAYLTNFTLEDSIDAAGLEVKIERRISRLVRQEATDHAAGDRGQAVALDVEKYDRTPLADHEQVASGDLVEVELIVETKNDYEYLIFEDYKPAGFEAVDLRSGYTGNALGAYVEFRDERVAFFVRELSRGRYSLTYRLRAETPGAFSALPARAQAMYAPELRANSDEIKLGVAERPTEHASVSGE